jgi:hypothetical protein
MQLLSERIRVRLVSIQTQGIAEESWMTIVGSDLLIDDAYYAYKDLKQL